jgi:peptidyl-tRNA hydrolase, PTH1 family
MSQLPIKLIAGLGNPGRDYADTRHNAGFFFIDRLAEQCKVSLKNEAKFFGKLARVPVPGKELWLLEPQTFMNRSGQGVGSLASFYKLRPEEILVVHDELDLPPGTVKIKFGGGVAGHNGLKDIAARLGSHDFWRMRIGIGHPGHADESDKVADYVLKRASREDQALIDDTIARGLAVFPEIVEGSLEAAMMKLHTKGPKP